MRWTKIGICGSFLLLPFHMASAQDQNFTADFMACAEIENPPLRYACFDETANAVRNGMKSKVTSVAPPSVPETVATGSSSASSEPNQAEQVEKSGKRLFGLLPGRKPVTEVKDFGIQPKSEPVDEIQKIVGNIKSFELSHLGKVTVVLENGQVWRQISGDSAKLTKSKMRRQTIAEIEKAAVGSYLMSLKPAQTSIRVKRIK